MTRQVGAVGIGLVLVCCFPLLGQKKVRSIAVRFQGAPQYSQTELLAAAGFKPGAALNVREGKAHAKQLSDTGIFDEVKFSADSKGLLFTLTPASQLYPMHLENLPLMPGKELDGRLRERFPLYRGMLPASSSMLDGFCRAFEEMLMAKGIKATVKAALTSGLGPQKITAMNFAISSPAVHIGHIQLAGVSPAMQGKAGLLASGQTGSDFDTENTAAGLRRAFEDFYQDQGYAAVEVDVAEIDPPLVSDRSVEIPYSVTIKEGGIYKVGTIDFPASAVVARTDVEKIVSKYPAGSGRPLDLFLLGVRDAYHARGYLDCAVVSHPAFNEATRIVNFGLEVTPGSQYRLASVKFEGAPEAMVAKFRLAWKMAPGEVFNESYLPGFTAQAQKKDKVMTKWLQSVVTTYDVNADPATHEVNCIFHFAKAVQSAH